MNTLTAFVLGGLMLAVVAAPRRWALGAMVFSVFFLTQGESVSLAGLRMWPLRFLEVAAFARVVARRELTWSSLNAIDAFIVLAYNYTALVWMTRSGDYSPEQFGYAVDHTIAYFALRGLVAELADIGWLMSGLALLLVPFTVLVAQERLTGSTAFAAVGANWDLYIRDGVGRAQGPFRHASLLGSIAASLAALYGALWFDRGRRTVALVGGVASLLLVALTHSGGPVVSLGTAACGWAIWPFRARMRFVRYAMVATLVYLAIFMKASIWYIPYKLSLLVGGGGYHRGVLMESAWNDIGRWWLVGMDLKDTLPWIPYAHGETGGVDITNEFVALGVKAGLVALVLWIVSLTLAFRSVGQKLLEARAVGDARGELLLWGVGVALSVHVVSWLGITYFDQSWVIWLLHLAAVSSRLALTSDRRTALAHAPQRVARLGAAGLSKPVLPVFVLRKR